MFLPMIDLTETKTDNDCDTDPCIICKKKIKNPNMFVHVVNGGGSICDPNKEWEDEKSDLGFHPIGPSCLKRFPELKPYVLKVKNDE